MRSKPDFAGAGIAVAVHRTGSFNLTAQLA
jgi:hypothetical protein